MMRPRDPTRSTTVAYRYWLGSNDSADPADPGDPGSVSVRPTMLRPAWIFASPASAVARSALAIGLAGKGGSGAGTATSGSGRHRTWDPGRVNG